MHCIVAAAVASLLPSLPGGQQHATLPRRAAAVASLLPSLPGGQQHATLPRRAVLFAAPAAATTLSLPPRAASARDSPLSSSLQYTTSDSGLKWAELRDGAGSAPKPGQRVTIDYMMTRRGGSKIYSTKQSGEPFTWQLGDGSVIEGLEIAVLGTGGVPPLKPGGIRRVIIPQVLGYGKDKGFFSSGAPTELRNLQPIPPEFIWADPQGDNVNSYLRFKNLYQNEDRLDQPDLIIDVALKEMLSAQMPDGQMVQVTIPPGVGAGMSLSVQYTPRAAE